MEPVERSRIVAEARTWVGTRWQHQASLKGVGTDCVGLLRGVALACGVITRQVFDEVGDLNYGRMPFMGQLEAMCEKFAVRISAAEAGPGDFVVMTFGAEPHHVAIIGDYPLPGELSIIHAYAPSRKVIETRMDAEMKARVYGWYHFPGVA